MLKRFFSLIFIILLLSSCAHSTFHNLPPAANERVQNRPMLAFNQVQVSGAIDVSLHTGYKNPQIILRGDPRDLVKVITVVKDNNLLVSLDKHDPQYGAVSVEIRGHYLNSFSYEGSGTVRGPRLNSGLLDLSIKNSGPTTLSGWIVLRKLTASGGGTIHIYGARSQYMQLSITGKTKVQIAGVINLSKLDLEGDGTLSMYWIKTDFLTICGRGNSFIELAGVVNKLDVELWGTSHFNGRYLRAKRAFVRTHDKAVADLTAIKHQSTLATDASDIYFYKIPDTKADFMAYQGSVLDMRDLNLPYLRDYDRYNK